MEQKLTPAQRSEGFSASTRNYLQPMPAVAGAAGATLTMQVPKARLLEGISLLFEADLTATHSANSTYTPADFAPYSLVKNISVELNNGFRPFNMSGIMAYLFMLKDIHASMMTPLLDSQTNVTASRHRAKQGITASVGGTANTVKFVIDLPSMLNHRDPIGLIMLQNEATVATVNITLGAASDIAPASGSYIFSLGNVTVTPNVSTFSIPDPKVAPMPDLSVIKLVQQSKETISGAGEKVVKLPVGNTYRSVGFYIDDGSTGVTDTSLTGNFELVFNTADVNISIPAKHLAARNSRAYGADLPKGCYILDFGYQGLADYGGFRDYVDSQRLTELWLRFIAGASGNITYYTEQLSQLAYQS